MLVRRSDVPLRRLSPPGVLGHELREPLPAARGRGLDDTRLVEDVGQRRPRTRVGVRDGDPGTEDLEFRRSDSFADPADQISR